MKKLLLGLMVVVVVFGLTACSPKDQDDIDDDDIVEIDDDDDEKVDFDFKVDDTYEDFVEALIKNDKLSLDPKTKGGVSTLQSLMNVAKATQLKEVEVKGVKELASFDQFKLYAFRLEADYESVSDVPMLQFAIMEKTDRGYLYYSQDDINTKASLYEDFKKFVDQAQKVQANYVDEKFNQELAEFKAEHQAEYDALLARQQTVVPGDLLQI